MLSTRNIPDTPFPNESNLPHPSQQTVTMDKSASSSPTTPLPPPSTVPPSTVSVSPSTASSPVIPPPSIPSSSSLPITNPPNPISLQPASPTATPSGASNPSAPFFHNTCQRLIFVARSIRSRPVYEIERIGGKDHHPLFRARVLLVPQGFSAIGVGRSKMSARRQAASAMLAIFENVSPELVKVDSSEPSQPSPPLPSPQTASERPTPSPEMEEGEVPSDAQVKAEKEELFFIDRHPDLDLEETTQTPEKESDVLSNETSTVKVECSIVEPVVAETDTQDTDARPPVSCNTYDKESIEGSPVEMQKDNLPSVPRLPRIARTSFAREGSSMDHVAEGCLPVMKRKRSLEVETNECNVQEEEKLNASYFVPPRKRTKSIPKDFSVRMQIRIFCDYSEEVMEGLRKLAEAHMMADISIQMYSAVDLPKYVLIGRNMAAEVTVVKEEVRKHPGAVLAALAFGVGAKSQEMWVERAKHLARGLAADRSPMMLVLNQDPAVIAMGQKGVIEVAKPSDNLVEIVERMIGLKQEGSGM